MSLLIRCARRLPCPVVALLVLALLAATPAAAASGPRVSTGVVLHARGVSVLLTATVNAEGQPTTYYFQYGPTSAYGSRTPGASLAAGTVPVKVGQTVAPFLAGYHYRIVASNASGTKFGRDRTFRGRSTKPKIELFKPSEPPTLGTAVVIGGVMTGTGFANHAIALQESAFPYLEPFFQVGLATVTSVTGRFNFHVGALTRSTQFRVITLDPLPIISPILTEHIAVRVTLKVRPSGKRGIVRLYGTVTPAEVGATVQLQLQKPARPGNTERTEERTSRWASQATTVVKRATRKFSRFSMIVKVRHGGLYRAYVVVRSGPLVSGGSRAVPLHAIARTKK